MLSAPESKATFISFNQSSFVLKIPASITKNKKEMEKLEESPHSLVVAKKTMVEIKAENGGKQKCDKIKRHRVKKQCLFRAILRIFQRDDKIKRENNFHN